MTDSQRDLTRVVLAVLFIGGLIAATFWILSPFLGALLWAVMIVIPTWPLMRALEKFLGRRWLAVTAASLILLLILILPVLATVTTIIGHVEDIRGWAKYIRNFTLPAPPSWLAGLPLVGERAAHLWQEVAVKGVEALGDTLAPYAGDLVQWFIARIGTVGVILVQVVLTIVATAVLYIHGEHAADAALRLGERLAGKQGEAAVRLSAQAIRGVALGVVVTALLQALIGGAGLAIAGVPFAAVLTALMFLLAVAQIGATVVLIVPVIWLYWSGSPGWGTFLVVVLVITATIDNIVRPILIKKGADLPLLLVFIGVIGGLVTFGLVGIFVGPVVLAVSYTLLRAWLGMAPEVNE
ncbi:MAG TPA: AI-2E family transporter YdiK [Burkholderiales bacterium]|nr:AI-2E family transporter YdiK [Burkholderiales bacterium]